MSVRVKGLGTARKVALFFQSRTKSINYQATLDAFYLFFLYFFLILIKNAKVYILCYWCDDI